MGKFLLGAVAGALAFFVYQKQIAGHGGASAAAAPAMKPTLRSYRNGTNLPPRPDFNVTDAPIARR
jgi:hypothetical protein